MGHVRIVRKGMNFRQAMFRWLNLVNVCLNIYSRHTRAASHDYLTEIRAEKVRKDTELAEVRKQKLYNELVIQDLKIEAMNKAAGHPVTPEWVDPKNRMP